jgi:cytochrome c-type biogenesis protein CcmF
VAIDGGVTRDVWSAISPEIDAPALKRIVDAGNRTLGPEEAPLALAFIARSYLKDPPPAQFHFIVSPLVMWIWIGGLIVFLGGAIAVWPAPSVVRARVAARTRLPRRLVRA